VALAFPRHISIGSSIAFSVIAPEQSSERRKHTGLGLAIARRIVEGFGGAISATNRPGSGASFEISLRLVARQ
jgi:signal transduction histidine kinase